MYQSNRNCYPLTQKEVKQKDSELKIPSLVRQIDRKNTTKNSKLLVKRFVNSFRKNPPICAGNVPKLPELSLFEVKKKVKEKDSYLKICSPAGQAKIALL